MSASGFYCKLYSAPSTGRKLRADGVVLLYSVITITEALFTLLFVTPSPQYTQNSLMLQYMFQLCQ